MQKSKGKPLKATKIKRYVIEPKQEGYHAKWEGHHACNPCVIRLKDDPRVFLGYRAGGVDDYCRVGRWDSWNSHLGLAILDNQGKTVQHRFPLPIITIPRDIHLPQNEEEFNKYQKGPHKDKILLLHDFRFWEDKDWLYVIYHEGTVSNVFDCIIRMKSKTFLKKVNKSIALCSSQASGMKKAHCRCSEIDKIRNKWKEIWWEKDVWEPCGVNGTNRIYSSPTTKNDIVFIRLANGSLMMYHRPVPDIAVLNTGQATFSRATADGITKMGSLQSCIRPGFRDNSHIGSNGTPIRAKIGNVDVYIDVVHGVYNDKLTKPDDGKHWQLTYQPYFRVLDYKTGDCLYYSEKPIVDIDEVWKEYVVDGTWVSSNDPFDAIMFPGGQVEIKKGRIGLDDKFSFYTGLGDTAVGRAEFRVRDLLPDEVIDDIQSREKHRKIQIPGIEQNEYCFPGKLCGWKWILKNDSKARTMLLERRLDYKGYKETGTRCIEQRPGYFDADGLFFDGKSIRKINGLGWVLVYRGIRWVESKGIKTTQIGYGIILTDIENPEKIFYRSTKPLGNKITLEKGWTVGKERGESKAYLDKALSLIPKQVQYETRQIYQLKPLPSYMTKWLKLKSGLEKITK